MTELFDHEKLLSGEMSLSEYYEKYLFHHVYINEIFHYGLEGFQIPHYELFTCYYCYFNTIEAIGKWEGCECMWDPYNTDDDCLWIK